MLSGCVGHTKINLPLTIQEQKFYNELKGKFTVIDSISREISKRKYGNYSYEYNLNIYVAKGNLRQDSTIINNQANQIVSFIAKELNLDDIKIKSVGISYCYEDGQFGYIAEIEDNGSFVFTLKP